MKVPKAVRDTYMVRCNGPGMRLDYHECDGVDNLVQILNDIASSCFILEKVIPQPGECFVVLFRRHDFG